MCNKSLAITCVVTYNDHLKSVAQMSVTLTDVPEDITIDALNFQASRVVLDKLKSGWFDCVIANKPTLLNSNNIADVVVQDVKELFEEGEKDE